MARHFRSSLFREAGERVPLTGHLAEFREALELEIDASTRGAAANAVTLVGGRRIGQLASSFQYRFTVESPLQMPDDSPSDLRLPDGSVLQATLVSTEGMSLVVSVPSDLGPYVPRAVLVTDLSILLRRLIDRIESRSSEQNLPGERLLGYLAPEGQPVRESDLGRSSQGLNAEQAAAVASALGRAMTFIWGPPGTGKTTAIGAIGAECYERKLSVLVVSHTNRAVDEAILKIHERLNGAFEEGSIIRVGQPAKLPFPPELLAEEQVRRREQVLAAREEELNADRAQLDHSAAELNERIALLEWSAAAEPDIAAFGSRLEEVREFQTEAAAQQAVLAGLADQRGHWLKLRALADECLSLRSRRPAALERLADAESLVSASSQQLLAARRLTETEEARLHEALASGRLLRRWKRLPDPEVQRAVVERLQLQTHAAEELHGRHTQSFFEKEQQLRELDLLIGMSAQALPMPPEAALQTADDWERTLVAAEDRSRAAADVARRAQIGLVRDVTEKVDLVRDWGLGGDPGDDLEANLAFLAGCVTDAVAKAGGDSLHSLQTALTDVNSRLRSVAGEIEIIEFQLAQVEEAVVADARIVATTLTRAYLRDSIQKRRFDVVILDEASTAPIPALWVAAGLGERTVVVGDFRQLPPICQSTLDAARKWLENDIFRLRGLDKDEVREESEWCVVLREQHRMHPAVSAVVNDLVYNGELRDAPGLGEDGEGFCRIYQPLIESDPPVLLVDTGPLGAWVTSVPRGAGSSRLNFLSAVLAVDLAERVLRDDRPPHGDADAPRVMIATPYRPQSRLMNRLLGDRPNPGELYAGTAHQLQGGEAPVVFFDLVNDEPHWRVQLFKHDAAADKTNSQLVNVALTRTQRRLVVIGDFDWIRKNTKPGVFLRELIDYLEKRHPRVSAKDLLTSGFVQRAAEERAAMHGGPVESGHERIVVTQDAFYGLLLTDLNGASSRVIVFSPFMTYDRVGVLQEALRAAVDRGVSVWIITKARSERGKRELPQYEQMETALEEWGCRVIHKFRMHEKLVFVDHDALWSGSLNPLSFASTQEVMERRANKGVVDDYARTLRLEEMLSAYQAGEDTCPICHSEMMPAEGRNEPFYWRCGTDGCYTRRIGQTMPTDGTIRCPTCGGPVAYGEWGGTPHWRCKLNPRHRLAVVRSHLKLPKMRQLVPARDIKAIEAASQR